MANQRSKALDLSRSEEGPNVLREDVQLSICEPSRNITHGPSPSGPFLTTVEAGAYLKMSPRTLEKLRTIPGRGPKFRRMGGLRGAGVRYCIHDLNAWLAVSYHSTWED